MAQSLSEFSAQLAGNKVEITWWKKWWGKLLWYRCQGVETQKKSWELENILLDYCLVNFHHVETHQESSLDANISLLFFPFSDARKNNICYLWITQSWIFCYCSLNTLWSITVYILSRQSIHWFPSCAFLLINSSSANTEYYQKSCVCSEPIDFFVIS